MVSMILTMRTATEDDDDDGDDDGGGGDDYESGECDGQTDENEVEHEGDD